jgi:hypothetical protein
VKTESGILAQIELKNNAAMLLHWWHLRPLADSILFPSITWEITEIR